MNAEGNDFDLILMDVIMPQLDGVSATSLIRKIRSDIPIIAMTSNIKADEIDLYFRHGKMPFKIYYKNLDTNNRKA